ncbi:alpha/beta hydrolase family protein [Paenibacillus silvisoli]|uniref:alpha/beta hydrolase family protein n=1 Tax=Paenibacillus silvisoli TaxID=3110539 RepID=UPI002805DF69|nr:acetylxylan esterase [Paenibacillus silvisoli]
MSFNDHINGLFDVKIQLPEYLRNRARPYFEAEKEVKRDIQTVEQFERRRESLRAYFLSAIGGLPAEKTPLNMVCTGETARETYGIRNIIFQSQPGVYVTGNLYMPNERPGGKVPAVIFTCGHVETAKAYPYYQKVCIDLVQNGFAVFAVDPISQGERMQYYDKEIGRNLVRWHTEHTYHGLQCELTGSNVIRYFVWDLIRTIDYLCTLPEIDETRIGMTGNSGGGIQTTYMMMVDDRLQAAVPCTYITSREIYMKAGHSQDGEQILYGAISEGLNFDDYLTFFAPKPVMIGAVESDFFVLEGTLEAYERARSVYRLYGCEEHVSLGLVKGTHEYNDDLRETAVNWFIRYLKGEQRTYVTDRSMKVEDKRTLQCTAGGQVLSEFEDARSVHELTVAYMREQRSRKVGVSPAAFKEQVRSWLNMPQHSGPIYPKVFRKDHIDNPGHLKSNIHYEYLFFYSEPDIFVTGIYVSAADQQSDLCTIFMHDEGVNHIFKENDLMNQLLRDGDVFAFDPRGMGTVQCRPVNPRPFYEMFGTEYKLNCDAIMMGMTLAGLRVYDILRACDYVKQHHPGKRIRLAGKGVSALYALLASVLEDAADSLYLENMPASFEDIVAERYFKYDARFHLPDVLKYFDIPELLEHVGDKRITRFQSPDVGNIIWW